MSDVGEPFRGDEPQVRAPGPGGSAFVFEEDEGPDGGPGRRLAFTDVDVKPLGYDALLAASPNKALTIPLEMFNGRLLDTNVEGVDLTGYTHITARLESPFTARGIGLVRGGWLPSALAATRETAAILPDRNVLTEIVSRFEQGVRKGRQPDFLDLFAGAPVRINPLLAALEGNGRAMPGPAEARTQLEEAVQKIRTALPEAILLVGPQSLEGLLGLIEDSRPGMVRKQALLRRLAGRLVGPVARQDVDRTWDAVLTAAEGEGVARNSLLVLALLSVVVNPKGRCAARRMLKFHDGYSDGDAYNALSDIRSLEILLNLLALFPAQQIQLCTADRDLALFWVGLQLSSITHDGAGVRFTLSPNAALLPAPYGARWAAEVA